MRGYDDPVLVQIRMYSLQACVPADWTDARVEEFAEGEQPCGARAGWRVKQDAGRVRCIDREGFVHVVVGV